MREPLTALPSDLESIPDRPAVFLLWAGQGAPYLARTALLRRRLETPDLESRAAIQRAEPERRGGADRVLADGIEARIGAHSSGSRQATLSRRLAAHHAIEAAGVPAADRRQRLPANHAHYAARPRVLLRTLCQPRRRRAIPERNAGPVSNCGAARRTWRRRPIIPAASTAK